MKTLKQLSRINLKTITGGEKSCTHSIQGSGGKWITRTGVCKMAPSGFSAYCETGLGVVKVTSNGGVSRC
ncbi:hypothetical protein ATB99_13580 [Elizabethkingia meningoseptica]|uniref:Uncharacterized protein n=1 Tax=Elizabethkingia meningoseptica TaxID=238 RepID=A0A1T3EZP7_ELIME|nr:MULTISPECIES: hypothetical protein [Elizabethkingia]AQX06674.1 hypothetical protein BBD33_16055 [Elizabethkingia meningoseptica]AQX10932.1 hypothetical protein BBD35_00430 [Elizabethkingia meningoseptica]AQX48722.1 hypothetical protein B5G46_16050 [Elizabethkingia meningoseptica]EOR28775.1 hypothetical protein L100_14590 [Elizabethkingia meningoseptica ATCC 13253 = NBRC 12535]KUY13816.1 hypothetical protein ATB99_13580 [Elizabethkingia meningoseptica]